MKTKSDRPIWKVDQSLMINRALRTCQRAGQFPAFEAIAEKCGFSAYNFYNPKRDFWWEGFRRRIARAQMAWCEQYGPRPGTHSWEYLKRKQQAEKASLPCPYPPQEWRGSDGTRYFAFYCPKPPLNARCLMDNGKGRGCRQPVYRVRRKRPRGEWKHFCWASESGLGEMMSRHGAARVAS